MKILRDFENKLLKRKEVKLVIASKDNPGFSGAGKIVADNFKATEENIVVRNVIGNFGSDKFMIEAFVYASKEHKEKIEQKPKVKKGAN